MKERLEQHKRNLTRAGKLAGTVDLSTVAFMAGTASSAKAAPEGLHQRAGIEATQNKDQRVPIAELTAQVQRSLDTCQDINYYRGNVVIVDRKTGRSKFSIQKPVLAFRYGFEPGREQYALKHPRSKYWAPGYITRPGNGEPKVVLLPFNSNGNNFVFERAPDIGDFPVVGVFKCTLDETGRPDITRPLNVIGEPINDASGRPLGIGLGVSTSGYLNLPNKYK